MPGAQTVAEDVDLVFSSGNGNAITVADLDVGEAPGELEVTLAVSKGGLSLSQTTGLTFSAGDGTADDPDKTMTFTGTAAQPSTLPWPWGLTYRGDQTDYNTATAGRDPGVDGQSTRVTPGWGQRRRHRRIDHGDRTADGVLTLSVGR